MSTILTRLARWARALRISDLPPAVLSRARLQHLSMAGAVSAARERPLAGALRKASATKGAAHLATGGTSTSMDALRLHTALGSALSYDDAMFHARPGAGVAATWAYARNNTLDELLVATVAANEIAGRLGASLILGPGQDDACAVVFALSSAVAIGVLEKLDETELAHAMALALADGPAVPTSTLFSAARPMVAGAAATRGASAVALARAGVRGDLGLLDHRDGLLSALSWAPLRNAFTGLGSAWLTETLAFRLMPGGPYVQVPAQAVAEILARHVKAADKRLRPDQIERIEVEVGAPGWMMEQVASVHPALDPATVQWSIRRAIGALVVAHELGPDQLDAAWLDAHQAEVGAVVSRVEVSHSWKHTLALVDHLSDVAAPLFAGLTLSELAHAGREAQQRFGHRLPPPAAADLLLLATTRPDRLYERLRRASGDLADARLVEWQPLYGATVRVHTTRGGAWPEDRSIAEGAPGWPWDRTQAGVIAKFEGKSRAGRAAGLLAAAGGADAEGWVSSLLSP